MEGNDRYAGKPLLRLVECYVLACVDELPTEQRRTLENMTPKLGQIYNQDGTWDEIIANVMDFPDSLPTKIKEIWLANSTKAISHGQNPSPEDFAMMFVDTNFVG